MPVAAGSGTPVVRRVVAGLVVAGLATACSAPTDEPARNPTAITTSETTPAATDAGTATELPSPLDTVTWTREVSYGPDEEQVLDIYLPDEHVPSPTGDPEARPAMVLVHGGGWTGGTRMSGYPVAAGLAALGWVAITTDYRLAPDHTHPAAEEDVRAALEHVHERSDRFGIDPDRVVLGGDSAGGHLSGMVALDDARPPVAAWVSWSGAYDFTALPGLLAGTEHEYLIAHLGAYVGCDDPGAASCAVRARQASALPRASAGDPPAVLLHSTDELIPLEDAEAMHDALDAAGVRVHLETFEGAAHGGALVEPASDVVSEFLADVLRLQQ